MALSVEPVMLSKAPRDATQEEPQPSTSASHFCIETAYTSGAMATTGSPVTGRFSTHTLLKGWCVKGPWGLFIKLKITL